jgi:hypothetical protein
MTLNFTIITLYENAWVGYGICSTEWVEYGICSTDYHGYGITAKVTGGDKRVKTVYIAVREKDIHNDEKLKTLFLEEYDNRLAILDETERHDIHEGLIRSRLLGKVIDP